MKATTRLFSIVVLISAARLVCTAQQRYNSNNAVGYPLDDAEAKLIQNDYLLEKRNKPSLSIVNPLDVLRKRLLLEMARRQMKENTRQVELNRAILKNVGKRMQPAQIQQLWEYPLIRSPYRQQTYTYYTPHQWQLQLQQLLQPRRYVNQLEYAPDVSPLFDYPQRPAYMYDSILAASALAGVESEGEAEAARRTQFNINALEEGDASKVNGNEMTNETANDNRNSNSASDDRNEASTRRTHGNEAASVSNIETIGSSGVLTKNMPADEVEGSDNNADYQLRYFYGLRKKHRNMKK
ncbi:PREDICTED: uncharacterized protein LOC108364386 [Rhagoletis zephyria]|uniref:uncharacterized protein LOC108364386 n=1 Tax=Rhagoletis zephyria TaxID=28612 RepID=UPI000811933F|nr:PREDICTED: uncharacterized protein LOC108364386 [Rhagoletis zephyria]